MRRRLRITVLASMAAGLGIAASLDPAGFALEERLGLGSLLLWRGEQMAPDEVLIVRFDESTLRELSRLPADPARWPGPLRECQARSGGLEALRDVKELDDLPRALHACLLHILKLHNAAAIVFDVALRPDDRRDGQIGLLADAIRDHGRVVLLEKSARDRLEAGIQQDTVLKPHPALVQAAVATAPFRLPLATEQVHQFWAFTAGDGRPQLPTRALEALAMPALERLAERLGTRLPQEPATRLEEGTHLLRERLDELDGILTTPGQPLWPDDELMALRTLARLYRGPDVHYLNFYGPPGTISSIAAGDLLHEKALPDPLSTADLRGRVVFIGWQETTRTDAEDRFATAFAPVADKMHGVEIAATALANLLHDHTIRVLPEGPRILVVAVFGFAVMLASCLGMLGRGLAVALILAGGYGLAAVAGFTFWHLWLPLVVPLLGLLPLALMLGQLERYLSAARALTIYTPRSVCQHLLKGHEGVTAWPQRREVTVLMTDIAGFTTLAERTAPEALAAFVNRHFTTLTACVEAEGGTVAQFIGDSMMAFWGAPDPQPDHAARACRTALLIAAVIDKENRDRATTEEPVLSLRIGIHTGEVTAGNVGAPGRSQYGIVGDTVNSTQRIEQMGKQLGSAGVPVTMLVSERTRAQAGNGFRFIDVGMHALRGRRETMRIFRLSEGLLPASQPDIEAAAPSDPGGALALPSGLAGSHG